MPFPGELAGLSTALCFAICSLFFGYASRRVGSSAVNNIRIAIAALVLTAAHGALHGTLWPDASARQQSYLVASGLVGLTLGDASLFYCIAVLGPRVGTLLMATAPLLTAAIAWPALGEPLGAIAMLGILATCGGVALVLRDDRRGGGAWHGAPGHRGTAILAGLLGALGQAAGLVMAKLGMTAADAGETPVTAFSATTVRMVAALAFAIPVAVLTGRFAATLRAVRDRRAMLETGAGVIFGPTLGIWLSLEAARRTQAGVAAALMATTPIFMLVIARVAYGSRPRTPAVIGTLLAVAGAAALFMAGSPA